MRKLKIGYLGHSSTGLAPADRRRMLFWAKRRGHEVKYGFDGKCDVRVVTTSSNLSQILAEKKTTPVVFDLCDAYHIPWSTSVDFLLEMNRNRRHLRLPSFHRFSEVVREFMRFADFTVFSSPEQESYGMGFAKISSNILDFHSEIPDLPFHSSKSKTLNLFWEGQVTSLYSLESLLSELDSEATARIGCVNLLTNQYSKLLLSSFINIRTEMKFSKLFNLGFAVNRVDWTLENIYSISKRSNLTLIPVSDNLFTQLKPENRILISWKLGLPVIADSTPSHLRLERTLNLPLVYHRDWSYSLNSFNSEQAEEQVIAGKEYLKENHSEDLLLKKWDLVFQSL